MAGGTALFDIRVVQIDGQLEKTRIEAAVPITLAQSNPENDPAVVEINGIATDLEVHADEIEVRGEIALPGRNVTIIARRVNATSGPAISVDGANGPDPAQALAKGQDTPDGIKKIAKGDDGATWGRDGMGRDGNERRMDGADGAVGAAGQPGGSITIIADEWTGSRMSLSAKGGTGGNGQGGQAGADGGKGYDGPENPDHLRTGGGNGGQGGKGGDGGLGGTGGDGGRIHVIVSPTAEEASAIMFASGGGGGEGGVAGAPGSGGGFGKGGKILEYQINWLGMIEKFVRGVGPHGDAGAEGPAGDSKGPGAPGAPGESSFDVAEDKTAYIAALATQVRPDHLQQCLNAARSEWFKIADSDAQGERDEIARIFKRIYQVMHVRCATSSRKGEPDPFESGLRDQALSCHSNYLARLDPFGRRRNAVPLLTYTSYKTSATAAAETLRAVETAAADFASAGEDAEIRGQAAHAIMASASSAIAHLAKAKSEEENRLADLVKSIENANAEISKAAARYTSSTETLKSDIESFFYLTPEQVFSALSTVAFQIGSPEEGPLQGLAQAGILAAEGSDQVVSDSGEVVHKPYLLRKLTQLQGENLKSELAALADPRSDQSPVLQAIAKLEDIKAMFAEFAQSLPSGNTFMLAIEALLKKLSLRNDLIYEYNVHAQRMIELQGAVAQANEQHKRAGEQILGTADPGAAMMLPEMRAMHQRSRDACLLTLARLVRARDFYLLRETSLADVLGTAPADLTGARALEVIGELDTTLSEALDSRHDPIVEVPDDEEARDGSYTTGILVVLDRDTHEEVFDALDFSGEASFVIRAPSRDAPLPDDTASSCLTVEAPDSQTAFALSDRKNPFAGHANVRLTRVRAFLEGMTATRPIAWIELRHLGRERLVRADGDPFHSLGPAIHAGLQIDFQYNLEKYELDADLRIPMGALHGSGIAGSGDLRHAGGFDDVEQAYTGIGPFGEWELRVSEDKNPGLSLKSVDRIVLDFHCICQEFH